MRHAAMAIGIGRRVSSAAMAAYATTGTIGNA